MTLASLPRCVPSGRSTRTRRRRLPLEAAGNAAALEVALSLRIDRELDGALRRRAVQEQVSPSALVRRLLRDALRGGNEPVLTARQVEEIARRVMRESA